MKPIITLFVLFAVLAFLWSAAAVRTTEPAAASSKPTKISTITTEKFESIKHGMSVNDASLILGAPPDDVMQYSDRHGHALWIARDLTYIRVELEAGLITQKIKSH